MAEPPSGPAGEFDCTECGRHIIQIAGPVSPFHLCAACTFLPGWMTMPSVAAAIDPDHHRRCDDA
jgi:hypothetical protein